MANQTNVKDLLPLFRILKWAVPFCMIIAAVLAYVFASNDMKFMLAGVFGFVAIADFIAFHIIIIKFENA